MTMDSDDHDFFPEGFDGDASDKSSPSISPVLSPLSSLPPLPSSLPGLPSQPPSPPLEPASVLTPHSHSSFLSRIYEATSSYTRSISFSRRADKPPDPSGPSVATDPMPFASAPASGRNQRKARKRQHQRHAAYVKQEEAQSHPLTRQSLRFPQRLVDKYGKINIAQTLRMKWFSVTHLAHATGAWVGLRMFKASQVSGWTAEKLTQECGFTLVEWDGRCAPACSNLFSSSLMVFT